MTPVHKWSGGNGRCELMYRCPLMFRPVQLHGSYQSCFMWDVLKVDDHTVGVCVSEANFSLFIISLSVTLASCEFGLSSSKLYPPCRLCPFYGCQGIYTFILAHEWWIGPSLINKKLLSLCRATEKTHLITPIFQNWWKLIWVWYLWIKDGA